MAQSERPLRFLVDANVGKLVVWLRILGYDTVFAEDMTDAQLVRLALAEDRIVLTRDNQIKDRRLAATGELRVMFIKGDRPEDQMRQVIRELGVKAGSGLFTRCLECNAPLQPQPKDGVRDQVPAYVYRTQESYMKCPNCGRIYWRGTHWQRMREKMEGLFRTEDGSGGDGPPAPPSSPAKG